MQYHFDILARTRKNLKGLLSQFSLEQVNQISDGFNNNIVWNVGHCIVIQQLLTYGLAGLEVPLSKELIKKYSKGSQASDQTTQEEYDELLNLLSSTVKQTQKDYEAGLFENYKTYTVGFNIELNSIEDAIIFNNIHEGIHFGYIMAQRKLV